ncbi:MAG TPA: type II toxin-antitoxin system VapC family toxin [Longimicrobiaceae bacterium]|nr:type II toxin-antitoxin system VapC family toxin [Longimicrobiaceae bacterium]
MPSPVLFDTDVLIDAARGAADALDALDEARRSFEVAVSSVTYMELIVGCRNKADLLALDRFLARFSVIPLDETVTQTAVSLLREFRLSHGLLIPDALIAATAIAGEIPLVSKNQRDYRFIPPLQLLPYPAPFREPPA